MYNLTANYRCEITKQQSIFISMESFFSCLVVVAVTRLVCVSVSSSDRGFGVCSDELLISLSSSVNVSFLALSCLSVRSESVSDYPKRKEKVQTKDTHKLTANCRWKNQNYISSYVLLNTVCMERISSKLPQKPNILEAQLH